MLSMAEHAATLEAFRSPSLPPREPPQMIRPTPASADRGDDGDTLTAAQCGNWRSEGFALVSGVWPAELIAEATTGLIDGGQAPGMGSGHEFPAALSPLNDIVLHPRLLRAVAQLLQCDERELRLQESSAWGKTSSASAATPSPEGRPAQSNADQRMHMDYPNMYLTHPPRWGEPEAVELILYYAVRLPVNFEAYLRSISRLKMDFSEQDVDECGGPTHVVPRAGPEDPAYQWPYTKMPGTGVHRFINDRATAERYLEHLDPELNEFRQGLYLLQG